MLTGPQVRAERERKGWTQDRLGKLIGGTQNAVTRIENSARVKPKWIAPLDKAFGGNGWRIAQHAAPQEHREVPPADWHLKEVDRVRKEMELLRAQMEKLRTFVEDAHKLKRGTLLAK